MSPDPRIPPLPPEEWGDDVKPILEAVPQGIERRLGDNNIFPTFARHPDLFRAWLPFGGFLLTAGRLSGRDRELLILRTAVQTGSSRDRMPRAGPPTRRLCSGPRTSSTRAPASPTPPGRHSPRPTAPRS